MPSIPPQLSHLRRSLLPSADSSSAGARRDGRQNVTWVEGVRGVASFFVVVTHLCRAWDYSLWFPRDSEDAAPRLLQLPFLRLPWQGRIGVTMFAFLTGYVCAIKPLRQAKSGNTSAALSTLAKSAFRRPPRLILPSTIAILVAWFFAQIGGFTVAHRCDSEWLRTSSPQDIGSLDTEIPRLFRQLQRNWVENHNDYDDHQWALEPLLRGAFMIYVVLFATMYMKNKFRTFTLLVLLCWHWLDYTGFVETFALQFLYGVLLCDMGSEPWFRDLCARWPNTRRAVQTLLILLGIYVAGYPLERPEWSTWSSQLQWLGTYIFPPDADWPRRWTAVGWDMAVTGIWLSPTLQSMFSNGMFMWLGRNSFAVYLTHGTVLRVFAARLIYGWSGQPYSVEKDEKGEDVYHYIPRPGTGVFMIAIPVFFLVEYTIASLWTTYVDAWCARLTKSLEDAVFDNEEEGEKRGMQFA
ncbi:uncharacterized protein EI97DRAFT_436110 [Westerdykella ornata]|uniref:Acyltransferase 3 domain-containing protein n=1 Tax=Westerdykella ornata TaxID=318751 RepID=A0A6A6JA52_WESOR|nr:uncharacterized protein EI97DRAFT_436110 [Westerdykella ornata]KAF2273461.1 hypothetical protein EI97DRAFT_436110 [Westerdykella ornata]